MWSLHRLDRTSSSPGCWGFRCAQMPPRYRTFVVQDPDLLTSTPGVVRNRLNESTKRNEVSYLAVAHPTVRQRPSSRS